MIARLEVTRGPLTEYPLAEKVRGGWRNGVTFYADDDVTKITRLRVSPEPQGEPSDALLSRIEQARVMVGLFRAWNVTPEQIETLRGILASAERIANGTAGIGREVER